MYKCKYSPEEKVLIVKKVIEGKCSINSLTNRTIEVKEVVVFDYISGNGSLRDICKKYKISDTKTLRTWILKYAA